MKKQIDFSTLFFGAIAIILFLLSCKATKEFSHQLQVQEVTWVTPAKQEIVIDHSLYETDVIFLAGEVLMPDHVHSDTLMVIDGLGLTWMISSPYLESDEDINAALGPYTIDYKEYLSDTATYNRIIRTQQNCLY